MEAKILLHKMWGNCLFKYYAVGRFFHFYAVEVVCTLRKKEKENFMGMTGNSTVNIVHVVSICWINVWGLFEFVEVFVYFLKVTSLFIWTKKKKVLHVSTGLITYIIQIFLRGKSSLEILICQLWGDLFATEIYWRKIFCKIRPLFL